MPDFRTVLGAENEEIPKRDQPPIAAMRSTGREEVAPDDEGRLKGPIGLAFSGGGIRSATFNLGILQGLAAAGLLRKIDYLSTVSGGGYIGSWLISWIKRAGGVEKVQEQLGNFKPYHSDDGLIVEPEQVTFLREYSNYMTPRIGIFGADTWAAISTYLRNVLLNQIILAAFLGAIVFLPWCVLHTSHWISISYPCLHGYKGAGVAAFLAGLALLIGVGFSSVQDARCSLTENASTAGAGQKAVLGMSVLPVFISALMTLVAFWLAPEKVAAWRWWYWPAIGAGMYGGVHLFGVLCRILTFKSAHQAGAMLTRDQAIFIPFTAVIAGGVGGFLLQLLDMALVVWGSWRHGFAHALAWGPGLYVLAFLLIGTVHIGLLKVLIQNEEQEWWGRMGGLLLILAIGWTALFALTTFAPWVLIVCGKWLKTKVVLAATWILTTLFGVLSGKSPKTSGKKDGKQNSGLELLALISPYVFIVGLFVLLSCGAFKLAEWNIVGTTAAVTVPCNSPDESANAPELPLKNGETLDIGINMVDANRPGTAPVKGIVTIARKPAESACTSEAKTNFWARVLALSMPWLWIKLSGLLIVAIVVAWRIDINIFSMNLLYRNRLVRCYLGASQPASERHPNPFTGFDPRDDISLAKFVREQEYDGPYPIVCASLNVTHGERLAWQERRAESFVFTPRYCGYEFPSMHETGQAKSAGGYHESSDYAYPKNEQDPFHADVGGVHLGTAISISGAAASPNMGFHTSPPLAFLMTVFNVRMGWWLANSRYANDELTTGPPEGGPPWSLLYLLNELMASTTDKSDYVYLSDGGHFENLAIYELVRRRCKCIIACDGDADANVTFDDLGNAIRKCRSDFGVEITLDVADMKPDHKTKFAKIHAVAGTIRYPATQDGLPVEYGSILYIKPTITEKVPRDILAYRDNNSPFPYQTTLDQWFDESQFESYRRLGLYSMEWLAGLDLAHALPTDSATLGPTKAFYKALLAIYPPKKGMTANPPGLAGA